LLQICIVLVDLRVALLDGLRFGRR
jgi:hypothetical protein